MKFCSNDVLSNCYCTYKEWVKRNPQTASEVESTIKWLSYFIAGKVNKSLVLTELIYSASNLLVLFNDIILQSALPKPSILGEKIKIWLTALEYSEVFIEISSKKLWGQKGKWIVIICVQLLKCIAKLTLLLQFNEKIISYPAVMPSKRNLEALEKDYKNGDITYAANGIAFCLRRSGRIVRKIESAPSLHSRLWKPPPFASFNNPDSSLPDKTSLRFHLIGEVLFTLKPLLTIATLIKYGPSAWKPWLLSAAADLTSLYFLLSKSKTGRNSISLSPEQRLELSRRRFALLLYLMRSPFYEKHSRDRIDNALKGLSRHIPLAKIICQPVRQYIPYWQETYFYMWSS